MSDQSSSSRKTIQMLLGTFGLAALFAFQNCSPDYNSEVYLMDDSVSHVDAAQTEVKSFTSEGMVLRLRATSISKKDLRLASESSENP